MFPKLYQSTYIDPFGAKESAISKCNDVTRQVLYAKLHYNVLLWLNDKCTHTPVFKRSEMRKAFFL